MNRKGIMGLPLKLTIMMMVLMLSIPVVTSIMEYNEERMMDMAMSKEASKIEDAVRSVYRSGEGSYSIVDIDIPENCSMTIGGYSVNSYTIACLHDGKELSRRYMDNPAVRFADITEINGCARLEISMSYDHDGKIVEVTAL